MLIKALTAGALLALGTATQALVVPSELNKPVVDGLVVHRVPPSFTTPPAAVPEPVVPTPAPGVVTAIPEPAAWVLMIAGFGLVGLVRRARVRTIAA